MPTTIKQYDNIPKNTVGLKGVTKRLLILIVDGVVPLGDLSDSLIADSGCQKASGYIRVKMRVGFIRELTNLVPLARWARWIGVRTYLQGGFMSDRA